VVPRCSRSAQRHRPSSAATVSCDCPASRTVALDAAPLAGWKARRGARNTVAAAWERCDLLRLRLFLRGIAGQNGRPRDEGFLLLRDHNATGIANAQGEQVQLLALDTSDWVSDYKLLPLLRFPTRIGNGRCRDSARNVHVFDKTKRLSGSRAAA